MWSFLECSKQFEVAPITHKKPKLAYTLNCVLSREAQFNRSSPQPTASRAIQPKQKIKFSFYHDDRICYENNIPFSPFSRILLLGEGNLSFAVSLLNLISQFHPEERDPVLVATLFESSPSELIEKYPEAKKHIEILSNNPISRLIFGIDATCPKTLSSLFKKYHPSRLVFNFPHLGLSIKDQKQNRIVHQKFINSLFLSIQASHKNEKKPTLSMKLSNGIPQPFSFYVELDPFENTEEFLFLLTVKEGEPYDSWGIKKLAKVNKFSCQGSFLFDKENYSGYTHVNTIGHYTLYCRQKLGKSLKSDFDDELKLVDNLQDKQARTFLFSFSSP